MNAFAAERLNLGSGRYPIEGWTNVDLRDPAEIHGDFRYLTFQGVDEVRMSHVLEHVSWRQTVPVLKKIRGWMNPGGHILIEVPDMEEIMALGTRHPLWHKYVYGDQSHEGEYHLNGFTVSSLVGALLDAEWDFLRVRRFVSTHKGRDGMPCLEAEATK